MANTGLGQSEYSSSAAVAMYGKPSFGKLLKGLRAELGCTQKQMSKRLGVPVSSLRYYENDDRIPAQLTAEKLSDAYFCDPDIFRPYLPVERPGFGALLKKHRLNRKISREDLAKALNKSLKTVTCYEMNQSVPKDVYADDLAVIFGVHRSEFEPWLKVRDNTFGYIFKMLRQARGFSMRDVARYFSVPFSRVEGWEYRNCKPKDISAEMFASFFEVEPEVFYPYLPKHPKKDISTVQGAINFLGFGQTNIDIAKKLNKSVSTIRRWRQGNSEPSDMELEDIVRKITQYVFETEHHVSENPVQAWFATTRKLPVLTADEELALAVELDARTKFGADVSEVTGTLAKCNMRLVAKIAGKYKGAMPMEDMLQEGCTGLLRAVKDFRHEKGYKFSTYAIWWIRQKILRAIANQKRAVRLPVHVNEKLSQARTARRYLREVLGREPTTEEIAQRVSLSPGRLERFEVAGGELLSLDAPVDEMSKKKVSLQNFIEDNASNHEIEHRQLQKEVAESISDLNDSEKTVIVHRYGLFGKKQMTLEQVGHKLGVTRERVRQIQDKALRKLRHPSRSKRLKDFYLDELL
ncbi:sigma-70 family RNA polymerase sigma factor [Candidatus Woesearchaeota archaeon]|nr:sigma-70 family RNA polymerase sigma factor [Candidatus Woesearchaeota archaeon]